MPGHDIITIGASAGGVEALSALARLLPADLPASVFVALHVPPHGMSVLPQILSRGGPLPAGHVEDGEAIAPGRIYVAPPDHHLLIDRGTLRLSRGPKENGFRPAIDPLFRSAARWHGSRVIGVVLSGTLDDGTAGLRAIKSRGGLAVVQDPDDALFPNMPRNALDLVAVDHVAKAPEIAGLLGRLARIEASRGAADPVPDAMSTEDAMAAFDLGAFHADAHPGTPSGFGCPDCSGVLWEIQDGEMIRYRCRVGHAWSPAGLLAEQAQAMETALWTAFRALEDRAALASRMAERFRARGQERPAARFAGQAKEFRERAALIRQVLLRDEPLVDPIVGPNPSGPPREGEAGAGRGGTPG